MAIFSTLDNQVKFQFTCIKCGEIIIDEFRDIPEADKSARNAHSGEHSDGQPARCPKCGCEYNVEIYRNIYESNVFIKYNDKEVDAIILK